MIWKKIGIAKYLMEYKLSTSSTDFHLYFTTKTRKKCVGLDYCKSRFIGNLCWTRTMKYINIYFFQEGPFFAKFIGLLLRNDKWKNGFYILLNFTNGDCHATMVEVMYGCRENVIKFFSKIYDSWRKIILFMELQL